MSDAKSPGDRLLEVVVFAPAGLAATIVDEFPKLVEKGRHRVEGQVHTARLVGQFAFQMGRRQIEQTISNLGARSHADEGSSPEQARAPHRWAAVPERRRRSRRAPRCRGHGRACGRDRRR